MLYELYTVTVLYYMYKYVRDVELRSGRCQLPKVEVDTIPEQSCGL